MKNTKQSHRELKLEQEVNGTFAIRISEEAMNSLEWSTDEELKFEITLPLWNEKDFGKGLLITKKITSKKSE